MDALRMLLSSPPTPAIDSLDAARARMRELTATFPAPIDRAIACASSCDRLGYAFACGYAAAMQALVPAQADGSRLLALAASEEGGAHPRAIRTRLQEANGAFTVDGDKSFVTLGRQADALLVVASTGEDAEGKNRLRVALVDPHADGVTLTPLPPTPFAPEIEHARARFESAKVTAVLEADGYDHYLKPFRTIEDTHVVAATLSYVASVARRLAFSSEALSEVAALLSSLRDLSTRDPSSPTVHVALGGVLTLSRALLDRLESMWDAASPEVRDLWRRDRAILGVAARARAQRLESAFRALTADERA